MLRRASSLRASDLPKKASGLKVVDILLTLGAFQLATGPPSAYYVFPVGRSQLAPSPAHRLAGPCRSRFPLSAEAAYLPLPPERSLAPRCYACGTRTQGAPQGRGRQSRRGGQALPGVPISRDRGFLREEFFALPDRGDVVSVASLISLSSLSRILQSGAHEYDITPPSKCKHQFLAFFHSPSGKACEQLSFKLRRAQTYPQ